MGVYNKWRKFPAGMLSHSVSQGFLLIINGFVNFDICTELSIVPSGSVRFGRRCYSNDNKRFHQDRLDRDGCRRL